jgi:hypothetical protein
MPTFHRTRGRLVARAVGYGIGEDVSARVFTSTGYRDRNLIREVPVEGGGGTGVDPGDLFRVSPL